MFWMLAIAILIVPLIRWLFKGDCDIMLSLIEKFGPRPGGKLEGQVIWITGASRGIGAALAELLAPHKVKLVLMARNEQQLIDVKQRCIEAGCPSDHIMILANDITNKKEHEALVKQVLERFNKISVLVSNAGRTQRACWDDIQLDVDLDLFDLNVFSLVSLARVVNKHFREAGGGLHAVMSSIAGVAGVPRSASYTASKHALHGYFEALRVEGADDNIDVTLLCPGPVETTLLQDSYTDKLGKKVEGDRVGYRMSAERCAQLCVVAIATKLPSAWIAEQPLLLAFYAMQYFTPLLTLAIKFIGLRRIMKMRDGRVDTVKSSSS